MMKSLVLFAATVLLCGCAATSTPYYDARFGDSVRQARATMMLNPQAGMSVGPASVGTLEGKTAAEASARYQESFKSPPPVVNVINIGGGVGGGTR